jgi:hypothetical protein
MSCACTEDMYRHQLELVPQVPDCDVCSHFEPARIRPHRRLLNAAVPQLSEQPLSLFSMLPLGKTDVEIAEGFWLEASCSAMGFALPSSPFHASSVDPSVDPCHLLVATR